MIWPTDKLELLNLGKLAINEFCALNDLPVPNVTTITNDVWYFDVCAYYRPECGIKICLNKCQVPCGEITTKNWTWPCSVIDREPYGVLAHELGHHVDVVSSELKGSYFGNYSIDLRKLTNELPITKYCDNDAEWFAEIFRLFITNPSLLSVLRPKTYTALINRWKPIKDVSWTVALGDNVPSRIINTINNKIKSL